MNIYEEIAAERARAHAKNGEHSMESIDWKAEKRLRILVEEVGEIARALNDYDLGVITEAEAQAQVRMEAVQTAAMATAWAASIVSPDSTIEIGGQTMTLAQYDAARAPLVEVLRVERAEIRRLRENQHG